MRNIITVIMVGEDRNLVSPGRFLLENADFSAVCAAKLVSNQLFTSVHVHDKDRDSKMERCVLIFQIILSKI